MVYDLKSLLHKIPHPTIYELYLTQSISLNSLQPPRQIEARSEQEIFSALRLEYREPEVRNA